VTPLTLALPSKGRLMEATQMLFARAGLELDRPGAARAYRGALSGIAGLDVLFLSAGEIAESLLAGDADLGVTGEDLLRERLPDEEGAIEILLRLGLGPADVAVAVPDCWFDVASMADLDEISARFHAEHGRRLRVATKYLALTRRFFADKGLTGYRIVESTGATEGAPASGAAELIVDITTTGSTLKANHLKILDDGVILRSEAVLASRRGLFDDARAQSLIETLRPHLRPRPR
jgi:ATP phosphoribosyltransferase